MIKYTKQEAIEAANDFIKKVNELEGKYNIRFNSDSGDIYLTFKSKDIDKVWDNISLEFDGCGSGIKVVNEILNQQTLKQQALDKLNYEERKALGL